VIGNIPSFCSLNKQTNNKETKNLSASNSSQRKNHECKKWYSWIQQLSKRLSQEIDIVYYIAT